MSLVFIPLMWYERFKDRAVRQAFSHRGGESKTMSPQSWDPEETKRVVQGAAPPKMKGGPMTLRATYILFQKEL